MSAARPARGFTLLEVMVAMAILAMALVAVFDVVGGALRAHEKTRQLELATQLARAKLVEVEAKYEDEGFRDFDQSEEGTFEAEGHPEVAWTVHVKKPTVELGAEGVVKALTGVSGGLEGLLGLAQGKAPAGASGSGSGSGSSATGAAAANPAMAQLLAGVQQQLTSLGEEIKRGVRELRLSVAWKDGARQDGFTVVTHLVVLVPGSAMPQGTAPALPAPTLPGATPSLPGFSPQAPAFGPAGPTRRPLRPGAGVN